MSAQDSARAREAETRAAKVTSPPVQALVEAYEREKDRVLAPLDSNFEKALSELKVSYTQAGNLNGALAADALIKARVRGDSVVEKADGESKEKKATRWKWGSGGELTINANGTAKHSSWKRSAIWEQQPDGSLVMMSETGRHTIEFLADGTALVKGRVRDTALTPIE